jgi:antitoxin component YwqK of YwqJK toxin-antitoxin module
MKKVLLLLPLTFALLLAEKIYSIAELEVIEERVYELNSKRPADGLLKVYFEHGELKTEVHFKAGVSDGLEKKFYPTGLLASAVPFVHGKEHGVAKKYYETGGLRFVTIFEDGLKEGISKEYYPEGDMKSEILFKKGEAVEGYKYLENGTKTNVPEELLKWIQPNTGLF